MAIRRSIIALPAAMLVLTSLILVRGGEPPRVNYRDREVLEAALKDMLDPKNPLYRNEKGEPNYYGPWPRTIVLHHLTGVDDWDGDQLEYHKMVSRELASAWKQRNSGEPIPLKKLGLQDRALIITDLDKLAEEADKTNKLFVDFFQEKYGDSLGYAFASLPGYSRGGTAAVVVFRCGPSIHGITWISLLTRVEGRWNVGWRHRKVWE
jgi:hypothetical protein